MESTSNTSSLTLAGVPEQVNIPIKYEVVMLYVMLYVMLQHKNLYFWFSTLTMLGSSDPLHSSPLSILYCVPVWITNGIFGALNELWFPLQILCDATSATSDNRLCHLNFVMHSMTFQYLPGAGYISETWRRCHFPLGARGNWSDA